MPLPLRKIKQVDTLNSLYSKVTTSDTCTYETLSENGQMYKPSTTSLEVQKTHPYKYPVLHETISKTFPLSFMFYMTCFSPPPPPPLFISCFFFKYKRRGIYIFHFLIQSVKLCLFIKLQTFCSAGDPSFHAHGRIRTLISFDIQEHTENTWGFSSDISVSQS